MIKEHMPGAAVIGAFLEEMESPQLPSEFRLKCWATIVSAPYRARNKKGSSGFRGVKVEGIEISTADPQRFK